MSVTPIADLVERLFGSGVPADTIVQAIRTIEMSAMSTDCPRTNADIKRTRDRERKREQRRIERENNGIAEANDAAKHPHMSTDTSWDSAEKRCDSFLFSNKEGIQEVSKKERKKEVVARARGTRLTAESKISDSDRQFARDHGMDAAAIDRAWAEFIDYWIGIPGQRGTKLDWSATWRNRVRQISGGHNATAKNIVTAAKHLTKNIVRFGPRPGSVCNETGGNVVRLLPEDGSERS